MGKDEAIKTLIALAICTATTQFSCDSCPRYSEDDAAGPCKNAWTDEQIEAAIQALI